MLDHAAGTTPVFRRFLKVHRMLAAERRTGPVQVVPNTRGAHVLDGTEAPATYWRRAVALGRIERLVAVLAGLL